MTQISYLSHGKSTILQKTLLYCSCSFYWEHIEFSTFHNQSRKDDSLKFGKTTISEKQHMMHCKRKARPAILVGKYCKFNSLHLIKWSIIWVVVYIISQPVHSKRNKCTWVAVFSYVIKYVWTNIFMQQRHSYGYQYVISYDVMERQHLRLR